MTFHKGFIVIHFVKELWIFLLGHPYMEWGTLLTIHLWYQINLLENFLLSNLMCEMLNLIMMKPFCMTKSRFLLHDQIWSKITSLFEMPYLENELNNFYDNIGYDRRIY